jgi:hypothetical protein
VPKLPYCAETKERLKKSRVSSRPFITKAIETEKWKVPQGEDTILLLTASEGEAGVIYGVRIISQKQILITGHTGCLGKREAKIKAWLGDDFERITSFE